MAAPALRRRTPWSLAIPESGRLGLLTRGRLIAEVLGAYPRALRSLRTGQLELMAGRARDVRSPRPAPPPTLEYTVALRLGNATSRTLAMLPTDKRCLVRSLVLLRLMAQRSMRGTLVIGVRPGPDFLAHAWVESGGRPVLPEVGFERLTEL